MKNIYVLPTDKPSRVFITKDEGLGFDNQMLSNTELDCQNQNIYITNSEEIKEGDWCFDTILNKAFKCESERHSFDLNNQNGIEKIILTTDDQLIKDGVQAIDDEFLEWFVKNPSCEYVELEVDLSKHNGQFQTKYGYKIIIPKEEQKQHLIGMMKADEELGLYEEPKTKCYCGHTTYCDCGPEQELDMLEVPMPIYKETLEEAAEKYNSQFLNQEENKFSKEDFINGAKWQQENSNVNALNFEIDSLKREIEVLKHQQERSYSEEEVLNKLTHFAVEIQRQNKQGIVPLRIKEWFDRNKKK